MEPRCHLCGTPEVGDECRRCGGSLAHAEWLEPAHGGVLTEFLSGLRLAVRGTELTLTRPRLLAMVALPIALSLILFAVLVYLALEYRDALRPAFEEPWPSGLDWLRGVVATTVQALGVVLALLAALMLTLIGAAVLNGPFLQVLSEQVETLVVGRPDPTPFQLGQFTRTWILPAFQSLALAGIQIGVGAGLLLLSLTGFLLPLVLVGGIWLTAISFCDLVVSRKHYPIQARFDLVGQSFALYLGLALPFALVPILFPLGVAGATLAYLREVPRERGRP